MKFLCEQDETQYNLELKTSGLDEVGFIRKRKSTIRNTVDFRKSQISKANWRKNKWKMMKGIKSFHKSTAGKKFHRSLGNFIATRDFGGLAYGEGVAPITSLLTHVFLELDYFRSFNEEVEYTIFANEAYISILEVLSKLSNVTPLDEHDEEFLLRLCETASVVKSLASKYNKSVDDVETMWKAIKKDLIDQGKSEDDEQYYGLLVSILKKKLEK